MRISLINLPWQKDGRKGVRAGSRWPFTAEPEKDGRILYIPFPFFLAYATSVLKKEGNEAQCLDAIAEELDEQQTIEKIMSFSPNLLVAEISTPSLRNDLKILENISNLLPRCQIAVSGPHASVYGAEILRESHFIDYILIGEYEQTLLDLVNHLESGRELRTVDGLAYREHAKIRMNNPRQLIENLDDLPWPERESLPLYKYNDGFCGLPVPNIQMWTSRGCPFACSFCLWPQTMYRGHSYRKRKPGAVVDEMAYMVKKFNFKAVYFDDDVFNIDRTHVLGICEEIEKRQIKIPWAAMARADCMDEELLESMTHAGLYAVKYGIESANRNILNFCKKNMDLDKARVLIRFTRKLGIKTHLTFCLGLPGETRETVQETRRFIQDTQPDSCQFSFATPFPGTDFFNFLRDHHLLLSDQWSDYDGNFKCIVKTQELKDEDLQKLRVSLTRQFKIF